MLVVFGRKKDSNNDSAHSGSTSTGRDTAQSTHGGHEREAEAKKNRPTPKRSTQEAKRKRSLVPDDRKEARRQYRAEVAKHRDEARRGVLEGDERFLTARDRGPQRRFVRDFVDARFSVGELLVPIAVVVLALAVFSNPRIQQYATIVVYGLFALIILDSIVMRYQLRGRLIDKYGDKEKLERGLTFYAVMRAIQLRVLRTPRPKVKRGEYPS